MKNEISDSEARSLLFINTGIAVGFFFVAWHWFDWKLAIAAFFLSWVFFLFVLSSILHSKEH